MSVVAIPFHREDVSTVLANIEVAARHERVDEVWAVGRSDSISEAARQLVAETGTKIEVFPESRIGSLRPGKGDAMNTALLRAAAESVDRLHFYDADITNFSADWIEGAERAADDGFEVVRHNFPRASTDAMITWLVTKPILAMKFPETALPRIGQPLGGELLLTAAAITGLAGDPAILERSDWGIDTLYTFSAIRAGFSIFEHYVADGKRHALYGSLDELRTMLGECFDAASGLSPGPIPRVKHDGDAIGEVPIDLRYQPGYDVGSSRPLVSAPWAEGEDELAAGFPASLSNHIAEMAVSGEFGFLTGGAWEEILRVGMVGFELGDMAWESLMFRLWVGRVLNYTLNHSVAGYEHAMGYLHDTVTRYERNALRGSS